MKKTILLCIAMFMGIFAASAQNSIDEVLGVLQHYRVSFDYEYVITGLQEITVQGSGVVQKGCFRIEGAGLQVLCDSESVWTLDMEAKEAYVEAAGPLDYAQYITDIAWQDNNLVGSFAEPSSGSIINFTLFNIKQSPISGDCSAFVPAADTFDGDWVITDLR